MSPCHRVPASRAIRTIARFNGSGGTFAIDLSAGAVGSPPPPPPPPAAAHVGDLDGRASGSGRWTATVTITAHDGAHAPLAGVLVTATWQGGASTTCTTGTAGACSVSRRVAKGTPSVWLRVTGLSKAGFTYASSANHDPDGDSDGTTITVARPA